MVKRVILGRSGEEKIIDLITAINDKASAGHTRPAGDKVLDEDEDFIWTRPDGTAHSVRDIDAELEGAQGRIEDAEQSLADSQVRLDEAEQQIQTTQSNLGTLETVTLPAAVQALEEADTAAQKVLTELDSRLTGVDGPTGDLSAIRESLAEAVSSVESAAEVARTANEAANAASQAALEAAGIAASKGRVIIQETEPVGEDRNAANIWIKPIPDDPATEIEEKAITYVYLEASNEWVPTSSDELAQAAQNALDAREAAQQAKQRADTAISNAATAQSAAEEAQRTANTATTDAREAHNEAVKAQAEADAAQERINSGLNLVKNPTRTGTTEGWLTNAGLSIQEKDMGYGPMPVLHHEAAVNTQIYSEYFSVDPAVAYEVRMTFSKPEVSNPANLSFYLGINATTDMAVATVDELSTHSGTVSRKNSGNFYFHYTSGPVESQEIVGYILPLGTDPSVSKGMSSRFAARFTDPATSRVRLRWLNWDNVGSPLAAWVGNVSVRATTVEDIVRAKQARDAADAAQARAEEAYGKAESAETKAGNAETSAAQAAQDLIEAREKATAAATDAANAFADAEKAEQAARDAGLLVSDAEKAADDAATAAGNALAQAQASGTSASQAQTAAQNANAAATEAERQAGLAGTEAAAADAAAARAAADAAQAAADLVIARDAAASAEAKAQAAQSAVEDAQEQLTEVALEVSGKSTVVHSTTAPEPDPNTLWIDLSDGSTPKVWVDYGPDVIHNPVPPFDQWVTTGGVTHDGYTIHIPVGGRAASPMIPTGGAASIRFAGEFFTTSPGPKHDPLGTRLMNTQYYDADGNPTANTSGHQGNGNAQTLPLNEWTRVDAPFTLGPDIAYISYALSGDSAWVGPTGFSARRLMQSPSHSPHLIAPGALGSRWDGEPFESTVSYVGPDWYAVQDEQVATATRAVALAKARADEAWELADSKPSLETVKTEIKASANGKNAITVSTAAPTSSTPGVVVGDTWWRVDGSGQIFGQWRWTGTAWSAVTIRSEVIANLDVHKLTGTSGEFRDFFAQNFTANTGVVEDLFAKTFAAHKITGAELNIVSVKSDGTLASGSVSAVTIKDGAITTPKLTVTEEMSGKIASFLSVQAAEGVFTKGFTAANATLIGKTVVDDINVQGKLIGKDGVFTGTVDFANINVTGEVLASEISGEYLYGTVVEGGQFVTQGSGGDSISISSSAFNGSPGLAVSGSWTTNYVKQPGIGPQFGGVAVSGGRGDDGFESSLEATPYQVTVQARGPLSTNSGDTVDTSDLTVRRDDILMRAGGATANVVKSVHLNADGVRLRSRNGISSGSEIVADDGQAALGFDTDGTSRSLIVDSAGVWVRAGVDHYNLEPRRRAEPFNMPSGWTVDGDNYAEYTITLGVCHWDGVLKSTRTLSAGWSTIGYAPAEARPRNGDQLRALPTSSGKTVLGKINASTGKIEIWLSQSSSGIFMHFSPFSYLV